MFLYPGESSGSVTRRASDQSRASLASVIQPGSELVNTELRAH